MSKMRTVYLNLNFVVVLRLTFTLSTFDVPGKTKNCRCFSAPVGEGWLSLHFLDEFLKGRAMSGASAAFLKPRRQELCIGSSRGNSTKQRGHGGASTGDLNKNNTWPCSASFSWMAEKGGQGWTTSLDYYTLFHFKLYLWNTQNSTGRVTNKRQREGRCYVSVQEHGKHTKRLLKASGVAKNVRRKIQVDVWRGKVW